MWRERNQQDATSQMFIIKRLSQHVSGIIMPSSGDQDRILPHMVFCTVTRGKKTVRRDSRSVYGCHVLRGLPPLVTVQNTICGNTRSWSPDDGHNDARNMLRYTFDNKHLTGCILLVSLSSPYAHDARSQEPKNSDKNSAENLNALFISNKVSLIVPFMR